MFRAPIEGKAAKWATIKSAAVCFYLKSKLAAAELKTPEECRERDGRGEGTSVCSTELCQQ